MPIFSTAWQVLNKNAQNTLYSETWACHSALLRCYRKLLQCSFSLSRRSSSTSSHTHTHTPAKSLQDLSLLLWHLNHHTVTASFFFSTCDNMTAPKASWWVRCQEVVVSKRQWETDRLTEESARQLVTQQIRVLLRHCSAFSDIIQPSDSAAEVRWRHPGQTTTFTTCDSWSSQVQKISGGDFIGKQHQLKSNLHM